MYASLEDYITRWGAEGLPHKENEERELVLDEGRIEAILIDAGALINSHLQKRFQIPFDPVPPLITALVLDVARFRLAADVLESSSPAQILHKEALRTLEGMAKGTVALDAPLRESSPEANQGEGAFFESQPEEYSMKRI